MNRLDKILDREDVPEELREAIRREITAQKLESVGRLAAGIAHNFNNYLTSIIGYSSLAMMDEESPNDTLEQILTSAKRAAKLAMKMATFSGHVKNPLVHNITETLDYATGLLSSEYSEVEITKEYAEDLMPVKVDVDQIRTALTNICENGIEAMYSKGRLEIKAENYNGKHYLLEDKPYIMISIQDAGEGIKPEDRDNVYDIFFSTREKKAGTEGVGLGLSIAYHTIKNHGGLIEFDSSAQGTTFRIYLPAESKQP